ncbi:hypothetical protein H8E77_30395 [bacterium]|nr:hypothetical protein [bacterium]
MKNPTLCQVQRLALNIALLFIFYSVILFTSGCMWATILTTNWSENYALDANGGKSETSAINDGKINTVAYSSAKRPRHFIVQLTEPKKIRKIVIHNHNLFYFELQYWDSNNMEWKTSQTVRQRRDAKGVDSKMIQPKYEFGRLSFMTDKIRINVTRTVDDDIVSKERPTQDDIVVNRIRDIVMGRFVEYYRVLVENTAGVREIEVYGVLPTN